MHRCFITTVPLRAVFVLILSVLASEATEAYGPDHHLLVDFRDDLSQAAITRIAKRHGLELAPNSEFSRGPKLFRSRRYRSKQAIRAMLRSLTNEPDIEIAARWMPCTAYPP